MITENNYFEKRVERFSRVVFSRLLLGLAVTIFPVLEVTSPLLAGDIRVQPAQVQLDPGGSQQLLVTALGVREWDQTGSVEYSSSNTAVATVTSDGLIRAVSDGTSIVDVGSGGHAQRVQVVVTGSDLRPPIQFATEVVPILTKLGCNSGGCHGKSTGQNGFKLSLLGFEPNQDYLALVKEARGRRIFPGDPDRSLLLLKPTAVLSHGGGQRLDPESEEYQIIKEWVARGAQPPDQLAPVLERIDLSPRQGVLSRDARQQLLVTAHFSDGTSRDVSRQAMYQSNEPDVASVGPSGVVETGSFSGQFAVMVRFGGKISTFHAVVPFNMDSAQAADVAARLAALKKGIGDSPVDDLLIDQWRRLGIVPSARADDATFVRRATIDICGTLPSRRQIEDYIDDSRPDKRARLIDQLLERPEYASYFALKWADLLQNRGAGYATSRQRPGTALFSAWIRDSIAANKPYDQFATEILTASGSQNENPPTIWYRSVRTLPDYVESIAQAFLGVRIQCAQCHHHPFERWSQADYFGLAAVFSRIGRKGGFADGEVPTNEVIYAKAKGDVFHPRTGELILPRALGGPDFELDLYADPRQSLARWMVRPDNPFFARTMANRMWAHFLGRGIIHPIDDARSTNPPSNPELLGALTEDFVASGYDVKHLVRVITNSWAYGLDSAPNDWNRSDTQSYARFYPRRLTAEVLLDGISFVLDVPTEFSGGPGAFPLGTRAIELPDENVPAHFLNVFGRPARMSACACERVDSPALAQALELVNSEEIQRKLTAEAGYACQLAENELPHAENTTDMFLRTFGRLPLPEELQVSTEFLEAESDRNEAYRSLLWSLLATNEFMFNH